MGSNFKTKMNEENIMSIVNFDKKTAYKDAFSAGYILVPVMGVGLHFDTDCGFFIGPDLIFSYIKGEYYDIHKKESICGTAGDGAFFYTSVAKPKDIRHVKPSYDKEIRDKLLDLKPTFNTEAMAKACLTQWNTYNSQPEAWNCVKTIALGACATKSIPPTIIARKYSGHIFQFFKLPFIAFNSQDIERDHYHDALYFRTSQVSHAFFMKDKDGLKLGLSAPYQAIASDAIAQILMGSKTGVGTLASANVFKSIWTTKTIGVKDNAYSPAIFKGTIESATGYNNFFFSSEREVHPWEVGYLEDKISIGFRNSPKECFYVVKKSVECGAVEKAGHLSRGKHAATLDKVGKIESDEKLCASLFESKVIESDGGVSSTLFATKLLDKKLLQTSVLKAGVAGKAEAKIEVMHQVKLNMLAGTTHENIFQNVEIISGRNPDFKLTGEYWGIYRVPKVAEKEMFKSMILQTTNLFKNDKLTQAEYSRMTEHFGDTETQCLSVCIATRKAEDWDAEENEILYENCYNKLVKFGVLDLFATDSFTQHTDL